MDSILFTHALFTPRVEWTTHTNDALLRGCEDVFKGKQQHKNGWWLPSIHYTMSIVIRRWDGCSKGFVVYA